MTDAKPGDVGAVAVPLGTGCSRCKRLAELVVRGPDAAAGRVFLCRACALRVARELSLPYLAEIARAAPSRNGEVEP